MIGLISMGFTKADAHTHQVNKHVTYSQISKHHYQNGWKQIGVASFYGPGFWGKQTSSGKIMRPEDMTAAHRTLPLGSKIKVTNKDNGKSVIVTVNDHGPYVGHRIIDLAEKPAQILDMKKSGTANVSITALNIPEKDVLEVAYYEPRETHLNRIKRKH